MTTKIPAMRYSGSKVKKISDEPSQPGPVKKARRAKSKITFIEPVSFEQAKEWVSKYMRKKGTAATDELAEKLHIDLRMLIDVLNELQKEGHIREVKE